MVIIFTDREDAGEKLWTIMKNFINEDSAVLAVPRGGVKVALPICRHAGMSMDIIVPKKIRAPHNDDIAIGAVAEDNIYMLNEEAVAYLEVSDSYIKDEVSHQISEIKLIREKYGFRSKPVIENKTVFIIDDGIATGMTLLAAIKYLKLYAARDIIIATPVASKEAIYLLEAHGAKVIAYKVPDDFNVVGSYYANFNQMEDVEVLSILDEFGIKS